MWCMSGFVRASSCTVDERVDQLQQRLARALPGWASPDLDRERRPKGPVANDSELLLPAATDILVIDQSSFSVVMESETT